MSAVQLGPNPSRQEILKQWNPENEVFWEQYGQKIARQNLIVSTIALTLSFCVWTLWSTIAVKLNSIGFSFTDEQLFTLAAIPGLIGATGRLLYTYMPGLVGGRNWTFFSTALLLIPLWGLATALQDPTTTYETFFIYVAFLGIAGANFSSSMANIGHFFPRARRGTALGINAGIGNLGVSIIFLLAPVVMGIGLGNTFLGGPQVMNDGSLIYLQNTCYVGIVQILFTLGLIIKYMDNLPLPKQKPSAMVSIFTNKHTWLMTWIYTCGFGSFIGFSVALSLLVGKEFPEIPFAYGAFLGPFIGAGVRPIGGWLADKINSGSKVTLLSLIGMCIAGVLVIIGLKSHNFILFFIAFLGLFFMTGFETGASFRMIPYIFTNGMESSLVTGFTAAIGAYGAFFIPKIFGWSYATFGIVLPALYIILAFTILTVIITYWFYVRRGAHMNC
ncbi:MFS transporter [uncultured Veillonella sp.]|uniref:MFS transporter n=1 Tax=uncultured Veillonella sp. TaxID=159268 RepID=UPI0025E00A39|nr:MFS transporter [uncultured Veillonella sp.]